MNLVEIISYTVQTDERGMVVESLPGSGSDSQVEMFFACSCNKIFSSEGALKDH
jgi:hypothetical protein